MLAADRTLERKLAGERGAQFVRSGMIVGLGTGTTAACAVQYLGQKMRDEPDFRIQGVCTSTSTERIALEAGIPLIPLNGDVEIDVYIDGADQVDPSYNLIKGGGGALLWEKLVAISSRIHIIVVDSHKVVSQLGRDFAVSVEIVQFAAEKTLQRLRSIPGCDPSFRMSGDHRYVTDEGNFIINCQFADGIEDPAALHAEMKAITGVIETGLFIGLCDVLVTGKGRSAEVTDVTGAVV